MSPEDQAEIDRIFTESFCRVARKLETSTRTGAGAGTAPQCSTHSLGPRKPSMSEQEEVLRRYLRVR